MERTLFNIEQESIRQQTLLSMIIDPAEQSPYRAAIRTKNFISNGGNLVMIGGSGQIDDQLFQDTILSVTGITNAKDIPALVLPGHIGQIPASNDGIAGIFNYKRILGEGDFESAYPKEAREFVDLTLADRQINSISTLYVLCGSSDASVSKVSNILTMDFNNALLRDMFYEEVSGQLNDGVDVIFFEAGSRALGSVNNSVVKAVKEMINVSRAETLVVVSGGISTPQQEKKATRELLILLISELTLNKMML